VPEDGRLAVFTGLIRPYKGVDLLLEAFSRLDRASDWFLLVAGEAWGSLGEQLGRRAGAPDLESRVRLELEWLEEARLGAVFAAADLLVLPYREGSQSAMAPLALAHGVPVLTTDVGGLSEVVLDGVNGVVVEPGSIEALASALIALDQVRLGGLASGALASSRSLTWDGYAAALEHLIAALIGSE
jgi:glycosyltransferase involved in cell wall biosynthesis